MKIETLAIVGVGLIGTSIGLAARRRGLAGRVVGHDCRTTALDTARSRGAIDAATSTIAQAVGQAQVVVVCTPVEQIANHVIESALAGAPGTLVTDTGSTKGAIVADVEARLPPGVNFVGSHPLAGSEKQGAEHADAALFEGKVAVVARTPRTDPVALDQASGFWTSLGMRVRLMDPREHDWALAVTSHLPHLTAAALASVLPEQLHELAAGGFRDSTRVAAGEPAIWTGIFTQNRSNIRKALDSLDLVIARFRTALESTDQAEIAELLARAKKVRDALGN
jgi:prephenate dehydrogenase